MKCDSDGNVVVGFVITLLDASASINTRISLKNKIRDCAIEFSGLNHIIYAKPGPEVLCLSIASCGHFTYLEVV